MPSPLKPPAPTGPQQVFRYSGFIRNVIWFGLVLMALLLVASILSWLDLLGGLGGKTVWLFPLIALVLFIMAVIAVWAAHSRITIDAQGIRWDRPGLSSRRLDWRQVRLVQERPHRQELVLEGPPGQPPVRVPTMVEHYPRLRTIIMARCQAPVARHADPGTVQAGLPMRFSTRPIVLKLKYGLAILGILAGIWMLIWGKPSERDIGWLVLAAGGLGVLFLMWSWHALIVEPNRLLLKAPLRSKEFRFADIADVKPLTVEYQLNDVSTAVESGLRVFFKNGKTRDLEGFVDMLRAHQVIEKARQRKAV